MRQMNVSSQPQELRWPRCRDAQSDETIARGTTGFGLLFDPPEQDREDPLDTSTNYTSTIFGTRVTICVLVVVRGTPRCGTIDE